MKHLLALATPLALVVVGCAATGSGTSPAGTGGLHGQLRLVPRQGVEPGRPADGAYADPRLRDVEFVDYRRPGFTVVYVPRGEQPGGEVVLTLRARGSGVRFSPERGAVGVGGVVRIENGDDSAHVVSCPAAGVLESVAPGQILELTATAAGPLELFALDSDDARGTVFAADGPHVVADDDGTWELAGLSPGPTRVRVWHPRFPPADRAVEVTAGTTTPVDVDLTVEGLGVGDGPGSR